jgi:hypothetical protein
MICVSDTVTHAYTCTHTETGFAIELDDDMHSGSSHFSGTFGNPPLHLTDTADGSEPKEFKCVALEMWHFAADEVDL